MIFSEVFLKYAKTVINEENKDCFSYNGDKHCRDRIVPVINSIGDDYDNLEEGVKKGLLIDILAYYDSISIGSFHVEHNKRVNNPLLLLDLAMNNSLCTASADLKYVLSECKSWEDFKKIKKLKEYGDALIAREVLEHACEEVRSKYKQEYPELCEGALTYMAAVYSRLPSNCEDEVNELHPLLACLPWEKPEREVEYIKLTQEEMKLVKEKRKKYFGE